MFTNLQEVDLSYSDFRQKTQVMDFCNLIEKNKTMQKLVLQYCNINARTLNLIAQTITNAGNQNLIFLDIRNNPIQDPQYKVLYGLLMNNSSILRIEYTLMEEKNLEMIEEFKSLQEQGYTSLSASQHLEHLAHEHHHRPTPLWQKICFPIWCWKSLIHDKHEAFRFKYDTESIRRLEETMMKSVKH